MAPVDRGCGGPHREWSEDHGSDDRDATLRARAFRWKCRGAQERQTRALMGEWRHLFGQCAKRGAELFEVIGLRTALCARREVTFRRCALAITEATVEERFDQ